MAGPYENKIEFNWIPKWRWQVLQKIIVEYDLKKICEIGVYKGDCVRKILMGKTRLLIEEYYGIDPYFDQSNLLNMANTTISQRAKNEGLISKYHYMCRFMILFPKFKLLRLPSIEACKLFDDLYLDLVFIDANHSYVSVKEDILHWMPKIKKGGILCGHDYCIASKCRHIGVKKAVDEMIGINNIWLAADSVWLTIVK